LPSTTSTSTSTSTSSTSSLTTSTSIRTTTTTSTTINLYSFVGDATTKVYYKPNLPEAREISTRSRIWFVSEEEALAEGYTPFEDKERISTTMTTISTKVPTTTPTTVATTIKTTVPTTIKTTISTNPTTALTSSIRTTTTTFSTTISFHSFIGGLFLLTLILSGLLCMAASRYNMNRRSKKRTLHNSRPKTR